ncbi:hypothetical protein [Gloeobacter kilaueensis]|uniref:Uncharacterized protein n=1 Tax=Gloeobacter kilaueensis (strain ATCC BAA-2537 / CCAP 1431/1 / ULC 316 / JS1) TaxID=1183438 RepID=U5QHX6_GLOK1|nr:hypothetical protein [Gloeobacter kilaueensis]AGY57265.1 hypothetical protein GKIL_1019 [Gloeobacter kilaueensis JS1]
MCIHYIEAEIAVDTSRELVGQIEQALRPQGEPLRWAIVEASGSPEAPVRVEAVVVRE